MKRNDTSPAITETLQDEDGNVIDITDSSVKFIMQDPNEDTVKISSSAEITDAEGGQVKYDWEEDDTDTAGYYLAEWEVTYSDDSVETFPNSEYISIKIYKDLD